MAWLYETFIFSGSYTSFLSQHGEQPLQLT